MSSVDKSNLALGLHLTQEDASHYPEFINLLCSLSQYLTSTGVSTQLCKDRQQAEEELRHEKHSWLLQSALYHELQELLRDYDCAGLDTALSSQDRQFYTVLQESLTLAEIRDYLECSPDPSSKTSLLGLSKDDLIHRNPHKKHLTFIQQKLIPDIEDRLRKKCESLIAFHDTDKDGEHLPFTQASQLPAQIEAEKHRLDEMKIQLNTEKQNRDKQFWLYYKTLLDSLSLLERLISKFRLRTQPEHDTIALESIVAKCDSLCLKIKLLELQVLCETYTMDTVKALHCVRDHLQSNMKESQKEYQHISKALKSYESIGTEFNALVETYRQLKEDVENKQWALVELEKGENKD